MQTQEYVHVAQPEMSDAVLAQQTLAGDQRAFEVLVHRYSTPLFNFICRYLDDYDQAWDVLQQVFLRFYTFLPRLSSKEPYKAWLFRVVRNCCVDELRCRNRHAIHFSQLESTNDEYETSLLDDIPDSSPLPEELAERHDLQRCLQEAIQTLPPKYRSVILLRYAAQLSFSEIGQVLGMPEATAKTHFHRGKRLLRTALQTQSPALLPC
jgi:RNA polymerase sigma factor (sigma-70 family)